MLERLKSDPRQPFQSTAIFVQSLRQPKSPKESTDLGKETDMNADVLSWPARASISATCLSFGGKLALIIAALLVSIICFARTLKGKMRFNLATWRQYIEREREMADTPNL